MRILLTTYPEKAFLQSMVPIAWALRTAGHEVRVASQPELTGDITQAGLTAVPVGKNSGQWRLAEVAPDEAEAEREGLPAPFDAAVRPVEDLVWDEMQAGYNIQVFRWHKMDNFPMIPDLVEFARYWQPDLVLWEPTTYAGAIAAVACGAAHARLLWSIDLFAVTRERYLTLKSRQPVGKRDDALTKWLTGYAAKFGGEFSEEMVTGQFTLDQLPPSLRMEAAGIEYVPLGYVPYGGHAVVPKWLWAQPKRPRVALTLGISATNRFRGYVVDIQDILDSLADLDIEIVATIAEAEQHRLTVPANTRVLPYVPLHALVPTCAAVIHHAGPGTLRTTSTYGVPQLALPWDFDEPELARRLAERGAGIAIHASDATGPIVRDALLRLLSEPSYHQAAAELRDEMLAMPSPNELVGRLEELTAKHRSR